MYTHETQGTMYMHSHICVSTRVYYDDTQAYRAKSLCQQPDDIIAKKMP